MEIIKSMYMSILQEKNSLLHHLSTITQFFHILFQGGHRKLKVMTTWKFSGSLRSKKSLYTPIFHKEGWSKLLLLTCNSWSMTFKSIRYVADYLMIKTWFVLELQTSHVYCYKLANASPTQCLVPVNEWHFCWMWGSNREKHRQKSFLFLNSVKNQTKRFWNL